MWYVGKMLGLWNCSCFLIPTSGCISLGFGSLTFPKRDWLHFSMATVSWWWRLIPHSFRKTIQFFNELFFVLRGGDKDAVGLTDDVCRAHNPEERFSGLWQWSLPLHFWDLFNLSELHTSLELLLLFFFTRCCVETTPSLVEICLF